MFRRLRKALYRIGPYLSGRSSGAGEADTVPERSWEDLKPEERVRVVLRRLKGRPTQPNQTVRYVNPASAGGDGTTDGLKGEHAAYRTLNDATTREATEVRSLPGPLVLECAGGADAEKLKIEWFYEVTIKAEEGSTL